MVTRSECGVNVKGWSLSQALLDLFNCLFDANHLVPNLAVVLHGLVAEGGAGWGVAVLKAFAAQLASIVLIHGHECTCKLTVLEETVHISIVSEEE